MQHLVRVSISEEAPFDSINMEDEKRVFLAYRAIFDGNNAQIRQPKAILKVVSQHRRSTPNLLPALAEGQVVSTLKRLLERKIFESELEAKLAFPDLFAISPAQDVLHNASEADAARSEAEALEDIASVEDDREELLEGRVDEVPLVLPVSEIASSPLSSPSIS